MRPFAPIAVVGSLLLTAGLNAQSFTENAAAIAGATIGTAAGKPLGTALGNIFGKLDKDTEKAANAKTAKKPEKVEKPTTTAPEKQNTSAASAPSAPSFGAPSGGGSSSGGGSAYSGGHSSRPADPTVSSPGAFFRALTPAAAAQPAVREPSAADLASIKVGASGQELQTALGLPESRVTIPEDDGRLLESCQYWSKGQPVGTVLLVNGQVVSVETRSN